MADGKNDPKEFIFNRAVFNVIKVENSDIEAASELSLIDAAAVIVGMTETEKEFVSAYLGAIIIADGHIDAQELALWRLLTMLCGFPPMNISDATQKLQKYI